MEGDEEAAPPPGSSELRKRKREVDHHNHHNHHNHHEEERKNRHSERKQDRDKDKDKGHSSKHRSKDKDQDKHRKHRHKKVDRKKRHKAKKDKKEKRKRDKKANGRQDEAKAFLAKAGVSLLERKDYFTKNPEFSIWIKETLNVCFDELEKSTSLALFDDFIRIWNEGRLPEKFYRGIPPSELDPSTRTTYRWGFAKKIDENEALALGTMRDEIATATHNPKLPSTPAKTPSASLPALAVRPSTTAREPNTEGMDEEDRRRYERLVQKQRDRQFESRRATALDELVPRADPGSRERRLEKRREKAGGKGDSEDDGAGTTDVMGGGDNFQARVQQERDRRARREMAKREVREKKLSEWQQKETERMAAFKQMMIAQGCNYFTEGEASPPSGSSTGTRHTQPQIGPARPF